MTTLGPKEVADRDIGPGDRRLLAPARGDGLTGEAATSLPSTSPRRTTAGGNAVGGKPVSPNDSRSGIPHCPKGRLRPPGRRGPYATTKTAVCISRRRAVPTGWTKSTGET